MTPYISKCAYCHNEMEVLAIHKKYCCTRCRVYAARARKRKEHFDNLQLENQQAA